MIWSRASYKRWGRCVYNSDDGRFRIEWWKNQEPDSGYASVKQGWRIIDIEDPYIDDPIIEPYANLRIAKAVAERIQ